MPQANPETVSIVIPAWNAVGFIGRAVASVQAGQEDNGLHLAEIIVVDDRSTDGTPAILEKLAAQEPRLKILRNAQNLGPGGTRNAGIAAAMGDWVAVLDADDAYASGRLPRLIRLAQGEGLDIIADLPVLYDLAADQAAPEQLPASGQLQRLALADLLRPDPATGLDLGLLKPVFRRGLATQGLWRYPEAVRHGEDFALYFDLVGRHIPFGLLHEAHYIFSTRIGAISGSYSPGSVTSVDYRAIAAHAAELAEAYGAHPDADPEVMRLLNERQTRALRQNRIHGWTLLRKREWARLGQWLRKDRRNLSQMGRMALAKLVGHRGLPD
jgi:succinoglycan biosynthesis protein ExoO